MMTVALVATTTFRSGPVPTAIGNTCSVACCDLLRIFLTFFFSALSSTVVGGVEGAALRKSSLLFLIQTQTSTDFFNRILATTSGTGQPLNPKANSPILAAINPDFAVTFYFFTPRAYTHTHPQSPICFLSLFASFLLPPSAGGGRRRQQRAQWCVRANSTEDRNGMRRRKRNDGEKARELMRVGCQTEFESSKTLWGGLFAGCG